MKKVASIFLFFVVIHHALAQNRNNVWMIGYVTAPGYPKMGIDFNSGSADTFSLQRDLEFFITNAGICDTNGQLLFYTNGDYIANRFHQRLWNTDNFNPTLTGDTVYGLNVIQAIVNFPYPGHMDRYIMFHENVEYFFSIGQVQPLSMYYSVIDMNLDSGKGGIVSNQKTIPVIADTLTYGGITATKQGNGRDWWVINHQYNTDLYYLTLTTPDTVITQTQQIGSVITYDVGGQNVFTPDGSKYISLHEDTTLDIFDFDRCTGTLSNCTTVYVPDAGAALACQGAAVSPNNRYLYVCNNQEVYQYDLEAIDAGASVITVAQWDSSYSPLATIFFLMNLAPDNKIYITTAHGTDILHVINYPDSAGLACNLVQKGLILPSYNALSLPNAVNYDLGPAIGSGCDTLTASLSENSFAGALRLWPNPAKDYLWINYELP